MRQLSDFEHSGPVVRVVEDDDASAVVDLGCYFTVNVLDVVLQGPCHIARLARVGAWFLASAAKVQVALAVVA